MTRRPLDRHQVERIVKMPRSLCRPDEATAPFRRDYESKWRCADRGPSRWIFGQGLANRRGDAPLECAVGKEKKP